MRWKPIKYDEKDVEQLKRLLRLPTIAARLLAARGLAEPQQAHLFLDVRLSQLSDPFEITHVQEAVDRIERAIEQHEKIVIFGDYDVDGITSVALMVSALRYFGGDVYYCIPRRFEEGYGLSQMVVERAYETGTPSLAIALDCGTNSLEQIAWMRNKGTDIIVVDHHRITREGTAEHILVNPNAYGGIEQKKFGIFCTAGLVFKCVHGLLKMRRKKNDQKAEEFVMRKQLDLVAMATIADVMPLLGENRVLVKYGLKELQNPWRLGTKAIMTQAELDGDKPLVAVDLSFRVCPRINASGRIADASAPVEMFLTDDYAKASSIATSLAKMNVERQRIESEITEEASHIVETQYADRNSVVLFSDHWHTGVIGIVAGKLMQRYRKPCVV
ncbi:MAG: DHH family phosphoesterase, partial [Puniceicoccales bacterium]|nr:DHH family phosphoesterase [Puniceicoccales bacterium]